MRLKEIKSLFRNSKKKSFWVLVLNFLLGINQGVSLLLLIPLIKILNNSDTDHNQLFISFFNFFNLKPSLLLFLSLFCFLTALYAIIRFATHRLDIIISAQIIKDLKLKVFDSLLSSEWSYYKKTEKSRLSNILISEIDYIGYGVTRFLMALGNVILLIVYTLLSFYVSVPMCFLAIACIIPFMFIQQIFIRKTIKLGEEQYHENEHYLKTVLEFLNAFKLSKMFQWEKKFQIFFKKETDKLERRTLKVSENSLKLNFANEVGLVLIICVVLFVSNQWFELSFDKLIILLVIASRIIPNAKAFSSNYESFSGIIPSYNKVIDLISTNKIYVEKYNDTVLNVDTSSFNIVRFKDVKFSYGKEGSVFNAVNLIVNKNSILGVSGASGSGKTTFIELLMGLVSPTSGKIYIDDIELKDSYLSSWKKQIAYVPQEPFLFNTSIRENIQMSLNNEVLEEFVERLNWLQFISKLPDGLETKVGTDGAFLSGGEKQRICIARALYKGCNILVLDEATNSLDEHNERMILNMLMTLKREITICLVSHNESVLAISDEVIELG